MKGNVGSTRADRERESTRNRIMNLLAWSALNVLSLTVIALSYTTSIPLEHLTNKAEQDKRFADDDNASSASRNPDSVSRSLLDKNRFKREMKEGTIDPGLFLIGLGKRSDAVDSIGSPYISAGALTNMKQFFQELRNEIRKMAVDDAEEEGNVLDNARSVSRPYEQENSLYLGPETPSRKTHEMRFVSRSKNTGNVRKGTLNPSFIMTGLGKK